MLQIKLLKVSQLVAGFVDHQAATWWWIGAPNQPVNIESIADGCRVSHFLIFFCSPVLAVLSQVAELIS